MGYIKKLSRVGLLIAAQPLSACGNRSVDLGNGRNAGPLGKYASSPPTTQSNAGSESTPQVMVREAEYISSFGIDGNDLYWVTEHENNPNSWSLLRCSTDDCAGTVRILTLEESASFQGTHSRYIPVLFDESNAFFYTDAHPSWLLSCDKNGCSEATEQLRLSEVNPSSPLLTKGRLYARIDGETVRHCRTADCAATTVDATLVAPPNSKEFTADVAMGTSTADADYLYFAMDTRILRTPLDVAHSSEQVARDEPAVGGMRLDGDNLYWTESVTFGTVKSCPGSGCVGEPTVVGERLNSPTDLALDRDLVYVTEPMQFVQGADGVQIAKPRTGRLARFAQRQSSSLEILAESISILGTVQFSQGFAYFLTCGPLGTAWPCSIAAVPR